MNTVLESNTSVATEPALEHEGDLSDPHQQDSSSNDPVQQTVRHPQRFENQTNTENGDLMLNTESHNTRAATHWFDKVYNDDLLLTSEPGDAAKQSFERVSSDDNEDSIESNISKKWKSNPRSNHTTSENRRDSQSKSSNNEEASNKPCDSQLVIDLTGNEQDQRSQFDNLEPTTDCDQNRLQSYHFKHDRDFTVNERLNDSHSDSGDDDDTTDDKKDFTDSGQDHGSESNSDDTDTNTTDDEQDFTDNERDHSSGSDSDDEENETTADDEEDHPTPNESTLMMLANIYNIDIEIPEMLNFLRSFAPVYFDTKHQLEAKTSYTIMQNVARIQRIILQERKRNNDELSKAVENQLELLLKNQEYNEKVSASKQHIASLSDKIQKQKSILSIQEKRHKDTVDQFENGTKQINSNSSPFIEHLKERIRTLEDQLAQANAKLAELTSRLHETTAQLQIASHEKSCLNSQLETANKRLQDIERHNSDFHPSAKLQQDLAVAVYKVECLEADLKKEQERSSNLEAERQKLLDNILQGNQRVQDIGERIQLPDIQPTTNGKVGGSYYIQMRKVYETIDILTGTDKTKLSRAGDLKMIRYYKNMLQRLRKIGEDMGSTAARTLRQATQFIHWFNNNLAKKGVEDFTSMDEDEIYMRVFDHYTAPKPTTNTNNKKKKTTSGATVMSRLMIRTAWIQFQAASGTNPTNFPTCKIPHS